MSSFSIHKDTRPGPVHLTVSDLSRSLEFYRHVLGFKLLVKSGNMAGLTVDEKALLVILTEIPGVSPQPPHTSGLYHFAILLPSRLDLARSLNRLRETRYPLGGCSDHAVSEALYLEDPDGNGIELYWDRPRSVWPFRNGILAMTTDPLDLKGLVAEALREYRPWESLSSQATIGHIHLHVGDLASAETFYSLGLGFDVMSRYRSGALFLSTGGYHHHIGINVWSGEGAPPPPENSAGLRYFTLCVPDQERLDQLAAHLDRMSIPVQGNGEGIFLRDPAGNGVFVMTGLAPGLSQNLPGIEELKKAS